MTAKSHNRDATVDFDQHTVMSPPVQREVFSPDESEQTRWNKLLTRGVGNYALKGVLGRGTFGTVYRAYDDALDRDVAIKVLNNPLDSAGMELFQQEARVIAALAKHPCIVQIHQWGDCDGCPYFVLEYIESSASDLMRLHPTGVPLETALRIAKAAAEALGHAHRQGILHRDIKPANILLEEEGRTVKLADFGLAHLSKLNNGSDKGVMAGSPPYMSPEQIECRPLDGRADIFSLGVSLYQMLSGKLPFAGRTASELFQNIRQNLYKPIEDEMPDLPPEVCAIIAKATAHRPEDRYEDGDAFAAAIGAYMSGGQESPLSVTERLPVEAPKRSHWIKVAAAAAVAAIATAVFLPLGWLGDQQNQVLAQARQELDKGDIEAAQNLYQTVLAENPVDNDALYGQGFVRLLQGSPEEAKALFEAIPEAPHLKAEGLAAVAAETDAAAAAPAIEEAQAQAKYAYSEVLLARMALLEQKHEAVVEQLSKLSGKDFYFTWQFGEALQLLGQAYYGLKAFDKAQEVFGQLQQMTGQQQQQLANAYLQMIQQQMDGTKSAAIRESAQRISQMLKEGNVKPLEDPWTSRPLTLFILPVEQPMTPFALESGLGDLLPGLLGDQLVSSTNLQVVDREQLQAILQEQELSAMLSTNSGQLSLGNVLGARLIVKPKFVRYGGKEQISITAVDTETTERRPVKPLQVAGNTGEVDSIVASLAESVRTMAQKEYPLQARLYQQEQVPFINIGLQTGLEKSSVFDVFVDPDLPPVANASVTVTEGIGAESARVQIEGVAVADLPADAAGGWYVKQRNVGA